MGASSFTARRSAAHNLPSFELPPPPLAALHSKYQPYSSTLNNGQTAAPSGSIASVGNLLTPPNAGDSLSPSSIPATNSTGQTPLTSFSGTSYWPQSTPSQYGYSSGTTPQWMGRRDMFSPNSLNSIVRSGTTPGTTEVPASSNYEMNQLPPFPSSVSLSSSTLPTMASQQSLMQSASLQSASQAPSLTTPGGIAARPPPTPTYFSNANTAATPNQSTFPFTGPSPTQPNTHTGLGLTQQQITPANSSDSIPTLQHMNSAAGAQYSRPYGGYSLPAMSASMIPGMHSQMPMPMPGSLMSGYGNLHAMYGTHHQQPQSNALADRPFKCDQCVQSFNRNHDLKRHKRIHLAVKPFPCGHCDKSFSRKDALKVSTNLPFEIEQ